MTRAQRKSDRERLIVDLDTARAEVTALEETNQNLRRIVGERDGAYQQLIERIRVIRDQVIGIEGASLDEVCDELDAIIRPPLTSAIHHAVDDREPSEGLHLIRQRTGGGGR